ncbi:conserved protein, unknown function [Hepatocystis sp. ex Piliocolobus tephrosceles]|nr:conserved protein, unknown function [Hepatocystis sp. ex Piliocolobus tephrosceles]
MAQNPWCVEKSKGLRASKLEKIINKFDKEYEHLMHINKFRDIRRYVRNIRNNSDLIVDKQTFSVVSISSIAQLQPLYLNNLKDGICLYLSNFMLKANHDVDGFCICFDNIKLKEKEPRIINNDPTVMFLKITFKLLILVLKENIQIKTKIIKIVPQKIFLDLFGMIEIIIIKEAYKDFQYNEKNNIFVRKGKIYSLRDIVNFTIKRITYSDSGTHIKLLGYI